MVTPGDKLKAPEPKRGDLVATMPARADRIIGFLNTRDIDQGQDVLKAPAGFDAWLRQERAFTGPSPSEEETEAARVLREGFRDVVAWHGQGDAPPAQELDRLNASLVQYPVPFVVSPDGFLDQPQPARTVADALGALVADVALCQASPAWARVKVCQNPACRWAYYDGSHSATQKWCSMAACGNRMKARRHRARRRSVSVNMDQKER